MKTLNLPGRTLLMLFCGFGVAAPLKAQTPAELELYSLPIEDGYVLESSMGSGTGGVSEAAGVGSAAIRVGDDSSNRQIRGILSYDTSALPDDVRVTSATLELTLATTNRSTAQLGQLFAHIRSGSFGSGASLAASDFEAPKSLAQAAEVHDTAVPGKFSGELSSAALPYINLSGRTQFRLSYVIPTDANRLNNWTVFYSGEAVNAALRPVLRLRYFQNSTTPAPTAVATPQASTPLPTVAPTSSAGYPTSCSGTAVSVTGSLPVFPGAEGFGTTTVAGSGRNFSKPCAVVFKVNNLNDSGAGSLRECVNAPGPRTCVFEVGGAIKLKSALTIKNPYITIAGQTAPYPGIILRGGSLITAASNVLVQHMLWRVGDDADGQTPGSRDGVNNYAMNGAISNIVYDHVSIAWALDEGWSIAPYAGKISNITLSNSIIASGLDMSIHPDANTPGDLGHSKGVLVNSNYEVQNFSFHHNLLAHNADRNIRIAVPVTMEYVNNVVYDWGRGGGSSRGIELSNGSASVHLMDVIGNNYIPGPDSACPGTWYEPERCAGTDDLTRMSYMLTIPSRDLNGSSRYFLRDNLTNTRWDPSQDDWRVMGGGFFKNIGSLQLSYPSNRAGSRVASSGPMKIHPASLNRDIVLAHAGAHPKQRDPVDLDTIDDVVNNKGHIINCVGPNGSSRCEKNAGGWPLYPVVTRKLSLPVNPMGDDNGNGYTNLEEWLQGFSLANE